MNLEQEGIMDLGNGLYSVLSSDGMEWYDVHVKESHCDCKGFFYGNDCKHLKRCKELWMKNPKP